MSRPPLHPTQPPIWLRPSARVLYIGLIDVKKGRNTAESWRYKKYRRWRAIHKKNCTIPNICQDCMLNRDLCGQVLDLVRKRKRYLSQRSMYATH